MPLAFEKLGPYRIGRQLGRGGMGTVFAAIDEDSGQAAAVKVLSAMLAQDEGFRARYTGRLEPEVLDLGAGIVERLDAYLSRSTAARTVVHGDLRIDNILFAPDGERCWLVDWQTLGRGSGATDLAYLVGTSIADPFERAAADRPAFDHWVSALEQRGIMADKAALWDDYRVGALSGYFMAVFASMSVERTERGDEMFAVMAERPARQALTLGSLDLL